MKFNEKLIELRKKKGMSQEELGYELNVTRQTVSKWELGQTTPEMDKLVEISKFFGISLDELTNNQENKEEINNEDQDVISNTNGLNKKMIDKRGILIILIVVLIIIAVIWGIDRKKKEKNAINFAKDIVGSVMDETSAGKKDVLGIVSGVTNMIQNQYSEMQESEIKQNNVENAQNYISGMFEKFEDLSEKQKNKSDKESFTKVLEMYSGTQYGSSVNFAIDKIVTNNKKYKDALITVIYKNESTAEPDKIQNIKSKINKNKEYEISYEYDENNYINKMDIK